MSPSDVPIVERPPHNGRIPTIHLGCRWRPGSACSAPPVVDYSASPALLEGPTERRRWPPRENSQSLRLTSTRSVTRWFARTMARISYRKPGAIKTRISSTTGEACSAAMVCSMIGLPAILINCLGMLRPTRVPDTARRDDRYVAHAGRPCVRGTTAESHPRRSRLARKARQLTVDALGQRVATDPSDAGLERSRHGPAQPSQRPGCPALLALGGLALPTRGGGLT